MIIRRWKDRFFNKMKEMLTEVVINERKEIDGQIWLTETRINKRIDLRDINELRQKRKVLMIGTAEHSNIGDAAITLAEQEILLKYYSDFYQVEFSTYELDSKKIQDLYAIANREDVIVMHGGGNLGDTYLVEENLRRQIIRDFPNNKIIIFPQTIYFSNTDVGKRELEITKNVYCRHKDLSIYARGEKSYRLAKEYFPMSKVILFPDTVMYLKQDFDFDRNGVVVSLRTDKEGILKKKQIEEIFSILEKEKISYSFCTNMADEDVDRTRRSWVVYNELKKYAKSKFIITDRLHGMIFAVVTKTPCIVMPTYNYKLIDFYKSFLKDSNAIIFLEEYNEKLLRGALENIKNIKNPVYPTIDKIDYSKLRNF